MTMTPDRQKVDRDEVFLEYTKSICPVCKTVIDGEVNVTQHIVVRFGERDCQPRSREQVRMIEQIEARLIAFRMAKVPALADVDFDLALTRTAQAAKAVRDGIAGYCLLIAKKRS